MTSYIVTQNDNENQTLQYLTLEFNHHDEVKGKMIYQFGVGVVATIS